MPVKLSANDPTAGTLAVAAYIHMDGERSRRGRAHETSGDSDHVAGMVSKLMVRLLLVRLAWACCKPRTQVAEGRARKKLAPSVAVTAVVGLIGFFTSRLRFRDARAPRLEASSRRPALWS